VGLSQLYVDGAKKFIALRGGEIRCNADVVKVTVENDIASSVWLRGNSVIMADAVILAVPQYKLVPILPPQLKEKFSNLTTLDVAPIVSIHLWFNQEFMQHESVGLIGRRIQWLFNRRLINHEQGKGAHVSAVISGAYDFVDKTKDDLVKIAVEDIRSVYSDLSEEPRHAVVVREKSATYSSNPASECLRPATTTEIPNLFLAGDWTATGYPATIEGAVLSGERGATLALEYLRQID
jgi:zeta-carotene desaturase